MLPQIVDRTFVAQVTHAWTFVAQLSSLVVFEQSRRVVQYGEPKDIM